MNELQEFYDKCKSLDWFYAFSDDGRVYRAGAAAVAATKSEAQRDPEKLRIFNEWHDHYFSGEPWKTEKKPVPVRP